MTAGVVSDPELARIVAGLSPEQRSLIDYAAAGRDVIVEATVGSGKALPDDARVPTPRGWRRVGEINIGDELYDRHGRPTRVLGVYPQGMERVYRVTLSDGRSVKCSGDHNWWVRRTTRRIREYEIVTTKEMLAAGLHIGRGSDFWARFKVPSHAAVQLPAVELPVDPYVLGAFIGNGSCTESSLTISCGTAHVPDEIARILGADTKRLSDHNYSWGFWVNGRRVRTDEILGSVPEVLTRSGSKSIPECYMQSSIKQRQSLVQGLMDTDGSISVSGGRYNVSYSTISTILAEQFRDLMGSLGHVVSMRVDSRGAEKYSTGVCHSLGVRTPNERKHELFRVGQRADKAYAAAGQRKRRDYDEISVREIVELGYDTSMTCFRVDNPEHVFLADHYVVTHNTRSIQTLCQVLGDDRRILYLTYSRLLKFDAQARVGKAKVQNYHGIVYPGLLRAGINCGIGESIRAFVDGVKAGLVSMNYLRYDMLVIDEYQDITTEYSELLELIKAHNPGIQIVMVGDPEQKVQANTTCDAVAFSREFTSNAALVSFTQSFRIGPQMAELVGQGWGKQITGANTAQKIEVMGYEEAVGLIAATEPGDLLCLGSRRGAMADALNEVEERAPGVFNKHTAFASVRDSGAGADPQPGVAVFTTFDSSKGMERQRCVVFDFDPALWTLRSSLPNVDKTVLRNIFLVAATRGKDHVVFVEGSSREERQRDSPWLGMDADQIPGERLPDGHLGAIPIDTFVEITENPDAVSAQSYHLPFMASQCFDFVYAEDVAHVMSRIDRVRVDDGTAPEIEVSNTDGLIDTSAAVGLYQEAVFFPRFDALAEMVTEVSSVARHVERGIRDRRKSAVTEDRWRDCLEIAALESNQSRYITQTAQRPTRTQVQAICDRLAVILDADNEVIQRPLSMALATQQGDKLVFQGVCDVLRGSEVIELKFTSELSYSMFLQTALYVVMSGVGAGFLFNTRTGEMWQITVPDHDSFLAAVTTCVTMRHRAFDERMP